MLQPVDIQPHQQGHKVWEEAGDVCDDEPGLILIERNEQAPDYSGFRRYKTLYVVRFDADDNKYMAKFMQDMGPAELYIGGGFNILGGDPGNIDTRWTDWETVGWLLENADWMRDHLTKRQMAREVPDLINGFYDQIDEEDRIKRHQSQSGPLFKVER